MSFIFFLLSVSLIFNTSNGITNPRRSRLDCIGCQTCNSGKFNNGCNDFMCKDGKAIQTTRKACLTLGQPFCKPDCSSTTCETPECDSDETLISPPDECCSKCITKPDCSAVSCIKPECNQDEIIHTEPDQCCPFCKPKKTLCPSIQYDLSQLQTCIGCETCPSKKFNDGCNDCSCILDNQLSCTEKACKKKGIPYCLPDCSKVVSCPKLECKDNQKLIKLPNECCSKCIDDIDCTKVLCVKPKCDDDEVIVIPPHSCCPVCQKDIQLCSDKKQCIGCNTCKNGYFDGCNRCTCGDDGKAGCTKIFCITNTKPYCIPNCMAVLCLKPKCKKDEIRIKPAGECCEICVKKVDCRDHDDDDCDDLSCDRDQMLVRVPGKCCRECVPGICPIDE